MLNKQLICFNNSKNIFYIIKDFELINIFVKFRFVEFMRLNFDFSLQRILKFDMFQKKIKFICIRSIQYKIFVNSCLLNKHPFLTIIII